MVNFIGKPVRYALNDWVKIEKQISKGEEKLEWISAREKEVRSKVSDYSNPLAQLSFLPNYRSHAKAFTIEEDRWLLCMISKYVLRRVCCVECCVECFCEGYI